MAQKIIVLNDESVNIVRVSLEHKKSVLKDLLISLSERERAYANEYLVFIEKQIDIVRGLLNQLD